LANILVDWVWCSGSYGIAIPQSVLGLTGNGEVDDRTIHALNDYPDQQELFEKIKQARQAYFNLICLNLVATVVLGVEENKDNLNCALGILLYILPCDIVNIKHRRSVIPLI